MEPVTAGLIVLVDGKAVNSCIYLALNIDGKEVLTVEGLSKNGKLDFLQEAFIDEGAVQCGYTPGMLMSAKALLDNILTLQKNKSG